jgi:CHAD domain-containing protein
MSYALDPAAPVRDEIRRCAAERLDRAASALERDLASDPEKAVHTARKSLKQIRSLLRLVRASLPAEVRRAENQALAELGRNLSGARDADVMASTFDRLATEPPALPARSRATLRHALTAAPVPAAEPGGRDPAPADRSTAQVATALRVIASRAQQWPLTRGGWGAVEPGLGRAYRRGRVAMRVAGSDPDLETLHEWRKRVKDHWYHLRLLAEAGGPAVAGQAEDASELADLLGEEHDLGVLEEKLRTDAPAGAARERLLERIGVRRAELRARAFALGRRVYGEKPAAQRRRLHRLWRAGRSLTPPSP